jgi:photosystem II stability/assembly factor-like uncharacterized protein
MKKILLSVFAAAICLGLSAQWSWQNQKPQGGVLTDVFFTSPTTGFAVGGGGGLVKTSDGGNSWQWGGIIAENWLNAIHFSDVQNGWVCGIGCISKTNDGGQTWTIVNTPAVGEYYNDIYTVDANTCFVVADNGLMSKTIDGGLNWTAVVTNTWRDIKSIYFPTPLVGYAVCWDGYYIKNH